MAKFLNTSATNYYLEEMIKSTRERLIIISPFLKFNDRIKELLEDKDRSVRSPFVDQSFQSKDGGYIH